MISDRYGAFVSFPSTVRATCRNYLIFGSERFTIFDVSDPLGEPAERFFEQPITEILYRNADPQSRYSS